MSLVRSSVSQALIGLVVVGGVSACLDLEASDGADDRAATEEVTSAITITTGGWEVATAYAGQTYRGGQVAYLNGINYVVNVGSCGSPACVPSEDTHNLTWTALSSTGARLNGGNVTAGSSWQGADSKVSLAAFNGFVYMLHTDAGDSTVTYLSKFDPATQSWNQRKLSFITYGGPPALAVYNGKLYLVGITNSWRVWYATMDTNESFSSIVMIPNYLSASRVSATVGFGKLWIAHREGSTDNIVYSTFDGTAWSDSGYVYGGEDTGNNGVLQGDEPVIAYDAGFIRLVHQRPGSGYLWNTTYNGCSWATSETAMGTRSSSLPPSLSQSANGLAMITESVISNVYTSYAANLTFYDRPSATVPCTIGPPGGGTQL